MTLIRWKPATLGATRDVFQDEVNRLFDSFFTRDRYRGDIAPAFIPAVDIEETGEAFVLRCDLPGISQNDVKVGLMGDTLTIRGERQQETNQHKGNYHRVERVHGSFERSFMLGAPVHGDRVKASYKDGVLEITVPKAEEARVREIQVQVAAN